MCSMQIYFDTEVFIVPAVLHVRSSFGHIPSNIASGNSYMCMCNCWTFEDQLLSNNVIFFWTAQLLLKRLLKRNACEDVIQHNVQNTYQYMNIIMHSDLHVIKIFIGTEIRNFMLPHGQN